MDVIEKLKFLGKFTITFFFGGGGGGVGGGVGGWVGLVGGQGGFERKIEVFVKIQKKNIYFFLEGVGVGLGGSGWM